MQLELKQIQLFVNALSQKDAKDIKESVDKCWNAAMNLSTNAQIEYCSQQNKLVAGIVEKINERA